LVFAGVFLSFNSRLIPRDHPYGPKDQYARAERDAWIDPSHPRHPGTGGGRGTARKIGFGGVMAINLLTIWPLSHFAVGVHPATSSRPSWRSRATCGRNPFSDSDTFLNVPGLRALVFLFLGAIF